MSEAAVEEVRRWPSMRFCDGPTVDATTRYDLNANGIGYSAKLLHEGFALGMPTLSGEPGGRARVWSDRVLPLPLVVEGAKPDVVRRLERVARELMREDNWLEWQLDADSKPRWFHTYASAPAPLSLARVQNESRRDTWSTTLSVAADPFAVGEEITLGPFIVLNAPSGAAYPMTVDLGEVEGEAAAPATVLVVKAASGPMLGPAVAITPQQAAHFIADSWGTATGGGVSDAGYLGGSYEQTTGALADWTTAAVFKPTGLDFGRWRTLLRVGGSADSGSIALRWKVSASGVASSVYSTPVVIPAQQQRRWVSAGEVPFPLIDGAALGVTTDTVLTLQAKRVQAGGEVRFDNQLIMLPADPGSTLLRTQPDTASGSSSRLLVDAAARRVAASVANAPVRAPGAAGGWPYLSPTSDNHLWFAQTLDPTTASGVHDAPSSETTLTVTYRPRYLWGV